MRKKAIKVSFKSLLGFIYGFIFSVFTPWNIQLILNRSHGVGNNPDGVIFIPVGYIQLFISIALMITIILWNLNVFPKKLRSTPSSKLQKFLPVSFLIIGIVVGVIYYGIDIKANYFNLFNNFKF